VDASRPQGAYLGDRPPLLPNYHPQLLGAIREVLARNELYGFGVEHQAPFKTGQAITTQTQVNMPEVHLASLSDQELAKYKALLLELRELVPKDEPKRIGDVRGQAKTRPGTPKR